MRNWRGKDVLKKCVLFLGASIFVGWVLYGLLGYPLMHALYESTSPEITQRVMRGRDTIPLKDYVAAADETMLLTTFWALAVFLILLLMLKRPSLPLYAGVSIFLLSITMVLAIQLYPPLADTLHLGGIEYYSDQKYYAPDAELAYRVKPFLDIAEVSGDRGLIDYGVETPIVAGRFVTDSDGFRNNTSGHVSDVAVLGDSMINSGRNFDDTFSKRLENHLPGLSVTNLGIAGEGPYQYNQVMKTYGVKRKPRYAIFSFNEGNDLQDIKKYREWKAKAPIALTYGYETGITSPILKFTTAYSYVVRHLRRQTWALAEAAVVKLPGHQRYPYAQDLSWVQLPTDHTFPITFIDKQQTQSTDEIQRTAEWQELRAILLEWKAVCAENAVLPIILFIPTAGHIYAEYSTSQSGGNWLSERDQQIRAKANLETALSLLSEELQISFVSLSPPLESAARNGQQVYESFNVHLNSEGLELAAIYVADRLRPKTIGPVAEVKKQQKTAARP